MNSLSSSIPSGGGPLDSVSQLFPSPTSSTSIYTFAITLEPALQVIKGPALYTIMVSVASSKPPVSWPVIRRYSEFLSLRNELTDLDVIPLSLDRTFPPRHSLSPSNDQAVINERLELLPIWLAGVAKVAQCVQTQVFRSFLNLDAFDRELDSNVSTLSFGKQQQQQPISCSVEPCSSSNNNNIHNNSNNNNIHIHNSIDNNNLLLPHYQQDHHHHQHHQHAQVETASVHTTVDIHVPSLTLDPEMVVMPVGRALAASKAIAAAAKEARAKANLLSDTAKQANLAADEASKMLFEVRANVGGAHLHRSSLRNVEADDLMKQHRATATAKAAIDQDLVASNLEAAALAKLRVAHDMHVRASAELLFAQHEISEGALHEEHIHVIEACAASARAKISVRQAASHKAEEEAALTALDDALASVRLATAAVHSALAALDVEKKKVEELRVSALAHKTASAKETQAAALASAQQDAHSKAAEFSFEQAKAARATELEITSIMTATGNSSTVSDTKKLYEDAKLSNGASLGIPHEGVSMTSRHIQGVGRALTTPGPNAAIQVTAVGITKD